jgi:hypothetical protein
MLNYSLQSPSFVHLRLYTVSGKQVASLEQGIQEPGSYTVNLGNGRIPAGLYVCRFQAGGYQENNRIIVTK